MSDTEDATGTPESDTAVTEAVTEPADTDDAQIDATDEPAIEPEPEVDPEADPEAELQAELDRLADEHQKATGTLNYELTEAEQALAEHDNAVQALQLELDRVEISNGTRVPEELLEGCNSREEMALHAAQLKQWRKDNPIHERKRARLRSGSNMTDAFPGPPKQEAVRATRNAFEGAGSGDGQQLFYIN